MNDERQKISICTPKDFDVSYFCGSGGGGTARNKVASGVQIIHRETGAIGRASDSRSQEQNKKNAFLRLVETPRFKFFFAAKLYEIQQHETMEETVLRDTRPENLKYEVRVDGKWVEVPESYFTRPASAQNSTAAKSPQRGLLSETEVARRVCEREVADFGPSLVKASLEGGLRQLPPAAQVEESPLPARVAHLDVLAQGELLQTSKSHGQPSSTEEPPCPASPPCQPAEGPADGCKAD